MKKDKILIFLFVGLAISVVILYFMKAKSAKVSKSVFPLVPGSTGKAVAMLQAANDVPITGIFDAATTAALVANGRAASVTAQQFLDSVALAEDIVEKTPIVAGANNPYVKFLQIMLSVPVTGIFDETTGTALQASIGANTIASYNDYRNLITKTIGI